MSEEFIKEARIKAAGLLIQVVLQKMSVLEALKKLPKDLNDPSVSACFHILVHFESDEDLRKKDSLYKEVQDEFLVEAADTLSKGEPLPVTIIREYLDFYGSDLIYKKNTKENILKRLKRNINQ